jgi:DNA-binding MarR family transcriptional regulator
VTEPRWLDAQERRAWLALLSVNTLLPATLDAHLTQLNRLSLFDYNVLAMLSEAEGRTLPMKELASRTSASLSRLSHVVTKLQARGWIDRRPSPDDARVTTAHLTDAGWETIVELAPEHVERVRQLVFDALGPDDVARLAELGEKIVDKLQSDSWIFRDPSRERLLAADAHDAGAHDGEVAP